MAIPIIIGDSCADLREDFFTENGIERVAFSYILNDEVYADNGRDNETLEFYNRLENGETGQTSQVNVQTFIDLFNKLLPQKRPIIYICFSSALSATYQSACSAKEEIMADNPEADITIVDTKAASLGEGLVLYETVQMQKAGKSKEEILSWLEENLLRCHHLFTVEELGYLHRGGRLSGAAAFLGDMLNIQPLMLVDIKGRLMAYRKERGRKKVLKAMLAEMEERAIDIENQVIAIGHGNCLEDAEALKAMLFKNYNIKEVIIGHVGPVIGMHVGPSVLAFFFWGKERTENLDK